jgi:hypothetical protein
MIPVWHDVSWQMGNVEGRTIMIFEQSLVLVKVIDRISRMC